MTLPKSEHVNRFISFLEQQRDSTGRANLAELRRAAADPLHDFRVIRILGNHLPDTDGWPFDAYRLVASLFAMHAQAHWGQDGRLAMPRFAEDSKRRSLGESLRRLRQQLRVGQESLDLRVTALLNTPQEDLTVPLRGLIQRIMTADRPVIPVDYRKLLNDLLHWDGEYSRRNWARDYWQPAAMEEDLSTDK